MYALEKGYIRERNIYRRLESRKIRSIRNHNIPRFFASDDDLFALEMSIVHVPCILDFGGAYLDFSPEHMIRDESWFLQKAEEFGEDWEEAQAIIREIEYIADIYLADVNPGNIKF